MTYAERKAERTKEFLRNHGKKLVVCGACNGSGRYDHNGAPRCSWCGGQARFGRIECLIIV